MKWLAGMAALLVCASAGASEVFKWTDEQGKVHYGDKLVAPDASKRMEVNGESPREKHLRQDREMRARWEEDTAKWQQEYEARKRERENRQAEASASGQDKPSSSPAARFQPPSIPGMPAFDPKRKSVPVNPQGVAAACKGLADRISKVKSGETWEELAKEFDDTCPGVAYECFIYKRHQKPDKCQWVKRTRDDNAMVRTNVYE
ncbi:MAG TPA: DUF4124 domain-containing protein [Fluviicoccus sp.]|nr:DUF4124 domain-containing protein [Fluviicoccus sp.]